MTDAGPDVLDDADAREPDPAAIAWQVGATDAFVLARSRSGRFVHRGGCGRAEDWAGNVELSLDAEPLLQAALRDDIICRAQDRRSRRVAGPYYATSAAVVPVDDNTVVVLGARETDGGPDGGPAAAGEAALRDVARRIVAHRPGPTPAKILADELEVLSAVQAVTRALDLPFGSALEHLVTVAAGALGCQLAVAVTGRGELAIAEHGTRFDGDRRALTEALIESFSRVEHPLCVQDAAERPLRGLTGVRSYLALPIAPPVGGVLVAMHTDVDPRGFTSLCHRIAEQLMEAASVLLQVASLRHELLAQVERTSKEARYDVLTGAANRLAWEEAITDAQRRVDEGRPVTLLIADLDFLKDANDHYGHTAGDHLIIGLAHTLERCVRLGQDVVARLGGDEFGVLLPGMPADIAVEKLARVRQELETAFSKDGLRVLASVGMATCEPHGSIDEAWQLADERMYEEKRRRKNSGATDCTQQTPPASISYDDVFDGGVHDETLGAGFDAAHLDPKRQPRELRGQL